jgi:Tfp pilus assembly protein PilO
MFKKMKKNMPLLIIILVALIAVYLIYFAPKLRQIGDAKRLIAEIDKELQAKAPLEQELRGGVAYIAEKGVTLSLSTEGEVPFVTGGFIKNMIKGLSMDLSYFEPQPIVTEGEYRRFPIKIGFVSDYKNFLEFLAKIRELKTQLRIDTLTVAKSQKEGLLAVQIDVSIFLLPGGSRIADIKFPSFSFNPFFEAPLQKEETAETAGEKGELPLGLQGVMLGETNKAIINDRFVEEGQVIDGYKVKRIEAGKVVLIKGGESYDLFLGGKYGY